MDKLKINQYKLSFDAITKYLENEQKEKVEVWFARDLQTVLGYARWENFVVAINRAAEACKSQNINVNEKNLYGEESITTEHVQNNKTIRETLDKRGIKPEDLPHAEDIKKLERKVDNEEKNIEQSTKKLPKHE